MIKTLCFLMTVLENEDSSGGCAAVPFSFLVLLPARLRRRLR